MNKKEFLKELENKLNILNDDERKDIINEYNDIISENVKHGKTEQEAINEFGSMDELVKEILEAYKINPNYDQNKFKTKTKEVFKESESVVKSLATKLSDFTQNVIDDIKSDNSKISIELIFEILIKIFIFLVICALLKIPFLVVKSLGIAFTGLFFSPFDAIMLALGTIIYYALYIAICVIIGVKMFNKYAKPKEEKIVKTKVKSRKKETKKETKEEVKEEVKEETEEEVKEDEEENISETKKETVKVVKKESSFGSIILFIIKLMTIVTLIFPILVTTFSITIVLAFAIYIVCKGIMIYGLVITLLGLVMILYTIASLLFDFVSSRRKTNAWPILIGIVIMAVGGLVFFDNVIDFNYHDNAPIVEKEKVFSEYYYIIDQETYIRGNKNIDNNLKDGEVYVKVYHYDFIGPVIESGSRKNIYYYSNLSFNREIFNIIIDDLKNKELYDYSELEDLEIEVYTNDNTAKLIK